MANEKGLTTADRRAWEFARRELVERQQWDQSAIRARAIRLIGAMLDQSTAEGFTLAQTGRGWRLGTGEGVHVSMPSDSVGVGLALLAFAVAWPDEPQGVGPFLMPGGTYQGGGLGAARKYITTARRFVAEHCPALAEALGAVEVSAGLTGPVATYRPPANAPTIRVR